jgi:hypothetical protein
LLLGRFVLLKDGVKGRIFFVKDHLFRRESAFPPMSSQYVQ